MKIVLTGKESNIRTLQKRFQLKSDFYEVRLDFLENIDETILTKLSYFKKKLILTLRSKNEFGLYEGNINYKLKLFENALNQGFAYVDIEFEFIEKLIQTGYSGILLKKPQNIIISYHNNFEQTNFEVLLTGFLKFPNFKSKIAIKINNSNQLIPLKKLAFQLKNPIIIAMDYQGLYSRLRPMDFNTNLIYVGSDHKNKTASGQIILSEIENFQILKHKNLTPIALFGGTQIKESPGIYFYNNFFRKNNLPFQYVNLITYDSQSVLKLIKEFNIKAASITMPLKSQMFSVCNQLDFWASQSKIVNTLVIKNNLRYGYNTDAATFYEIAKHNPDFKQTLILGAGNTASSAITSLLNLGYEVVIAARNPNKVKFNKKIKVINWEKMHLIHHKALINTTPVGFDGKFSPWNRNTLNCNTVLDLVLTSNETQLVTQAKKEKKKVISGDDFWKIQGKIQMDIFLKNLLY